MLPAPPPSESNLKATARRNGLDISASPENSSHCGPRNPARFFARSLFQKPLAILPATAFRATTAFGRVPNRYSKPFVPGALTPFEKLLFIERLNHENRSSRNQRLTKATKKGFSNLVLKAFA